MSGIRRKHYIEDEDAATLKLGREFQNASCLMNTEVKFLLEQREASKGVTPPDSAVYNKTKAYVQTFSKFSRSSIESYRAAYIANRNLDKDLQELTEFEFAQLANLCPRDAEEAKNCIPSLIVKIDDDRLQSILDEVHTLRRYQN